MLCPVLYIQRCCSYTCPALNLTFVICNAGEAPQIQLSTVCCSGDVPSLPAPACRQEQKRLADNVLLRSIVLEDLCAGRQVQPPVTAHQRAASCLPRVVSVILVPVCWVLPPTSFFGMSRRPAALGSTGGMRGCFALHPARFATLYSFPRENDKEQSRDAGLWLFGVCF